jgi:aminopeptidase-like protein
MGKRGLYPTLSTRKSGEQVRLMMDLISLCDGVNSLLDIAEILGAPIWNLYELCDKLKAHGLLSVDE